MQAEYSRAGRPNAGAHIASMWPQTWSSWSALSSRSPVVMAVLFLGCALLVTAASSPTKGTKLFKGDRCNWWTLTRTLFHSANLSVHSHVMLVGTMLDWTALRQSTIKNKRAKSHNKPWRNSLGIQFLNEWAHRCSFKVIQASMSPYPSTFPVIQIICSSDKVFPSVLFKKKSQGCKEKHLILTGEFYYAQWTAGAGQTFWMVHVLHSGQQETQMHARVQRWAEESKSCYKLSCGGMPVNTADPWTC